MNVEVPLMPQTHTLRDDDALLVRRGDHTTALASEELAEVVDALLTDSHPGRLTLPEGDSAEGVAEFIRLLEQAGLVTREPVEEVSSAARSLWATDPEANDLQELQARLDQTQVLVLGDSPMTEVLSDCLATVGVRTTVESDLDAVETVFEDPQLLPTVIGAHLRDARLTRANEAAVRSGRRWMPVIESDGLRTLIGPWMVPSSSACLECLWLRRTANSADSELVGRLTAARPVQASPARAVPAGHDHLVSGILSEKLVELIGLADRAAAAAPGRMCVISRSAPGVSVEEHLVLRVPRCSVCSPARGRGYPQVWAHPGAEEREGA